MAKDIIVTQIEELSQNEGMSDTDIAMKLGYARGSIQRIRMEHNIPKANIQKKKDKPCTCVKCHKLFMIRRCESAKIVCPECEDLINQL